MEIVYHADFTSAWTTVYQKPKNSCYKEKIRKTVFH